jgi:hypothetical protein
MGSRPIALAVLSYMTPNNAVRLLSLSGRTYRGGEVRCGSSSLEV